MKNLIQRSKKTLFAGSALILGGATQAQAALASTDVPTSGITADIGVVFIALLAVALAVFGVKKVVGMF